MEELRELLPIPADELCLCIDADCPNCGYPERITPLPGNGIGEIFGCRKCDYVSRGRNS